MDDSTAVAKRLVGFVGKIQTETARYFAQHYSNLTVPTIEVVVGSKYFKIVSVSSDSRSVHSFVDKANGDIFKAASWLIPAKHVRGSIFDADYSWGKGVTMYGGSYLR
jgi:hypothetical protein